MQNLIVLGQIPGTHIQITFAVWKTILVIVLAMIAVSLFRTLIHRILHHPVRYSAPTDQALQVDSADQQ